jgi:hypothetical protein
VFRLNKPDSACVHACLLSCTLLDEVNMNARMDSVPYIFLGLNEAHAQYLFCTEKLHKSKEDSVYVWAI